MLPLLLVAATFPVRFSAHLGALASFSLFDLVMPIVLLDYLFWLNWQKKTVDPATGRSPISVGQLAVAATAVSALSLAWSVEPSATLLSCVSHAEGVLVYFYVVRVLRAHPPERVLAYCAFFVVSLLVAPVLLLLHVPGFAPPVELNPSSGDYISYYVRLSHPFIGRSNNLATLLAFFVLPLFQWSLRQHSRRIGTLAVVTFMAVVLTFSRGVLLGLVVGCLGFISSVPLLRARLLRGVVVALGVGSSAALLLYTQNPNTGRYLSARLSYAGVDARVNLLTTVSDVFNQQWWLGRGADATLSVHNTFLQQFVDYGLGLALVMCLIFYRAASSFFSGKPDDVRKAVGWSFVALLVSFLFESSFEGRLLNPLLFLCFGLGVALVRAQERAADAASSDNPVASAHPALAR